MRGSSPRMTSFDGRERVLASVNARVTLVTANHRRRDRAAGGDNLSN